MNIPSSARPYNGTPSATLLQASRGNSPPFRRCPTVHSPPQTSSSTCNGASPSYASSSSSSNSSCFSRRSSYFSRFEDIRYSSRQRRAGCLSVRCASSEIVSPRLWRHRWRYMRSEAARKGQGLPKADWQRYHLQVLMCWRPLLRYVARESDGLSMPLAT